MLQFTYVAGPIVGHELCELSLRDLRCTAAQVLARCPHEARDEQWNVFATISQRRNRDREHAQPIEDIEPKVPGIDVSAKISIRRGNHSDVGAARDLLANALELPFLKDAQELRLEIGWNVTDLVEKKSSTVREFESPDSVTNSPCERAPYMTKEFTLEQLSRKRGAVHLYQGMLRSRASGMNCARDELLTRSRLALNEYVCLGWRNEIDLSQETSECCTLADDTIHGDREGCFFTKVIALELQLLAKSRNLLQ